MSRIRRVSIEVIRREFSITNSTGSHSEERRSRTAQQAASVKPEAQGVYPGECVLCTSPWFVLPRCGKEDQATIQRAMLKHGIHAHLSAMGELLICSKSFQLNIGPSGVDNA